MRGFTLPRGFVLAGVVLGIALVGAFAAGPARADGHLASLTARGSIVFSNLPSASAANAGVLAQHEIRPFPNEPEAATDAPPQSVPVAQIDPGQTNPISGDKAGLITSFPGINHRQQRLADNGNQFSLEPPDQALCVGNGFLIESVNLALRIHTTDGTPVGGIVSLNQFFNLPSTFVRPAGPFGPFLSDPKCYYDPDTGRFFVTVLEADTNPADSSLTGPTSVLIATSQTSDPTGGWNIFSINTTDDGKGGTPSHPGCPCLGDQPLIGADANGFFVTTNEFTDVKDQLVHADFNGAQIYAMSKLALENGTAPKVVQFESPPVFGDIAFSVQPATTPTGKYETAAGGTEYFLSSLDFDATSANNIALWSITNTSSLATATPNVKLTNTVIPSELYGQPPDAEQKNGPTPLRDCLNIPFCSTDFVLGVPDPFAPEQLEKIAGNDDRMNQVVFANGRLWSGVNTAVQFTRHSDPNVGIAFFVVQPSVSAGTGGVTLNGVMSNSGYVSVLRNNVLYPSIGVNDAGQAVMSMSLVGPNFYPSSVYTTVGGTPSDGRDHGPVRIAAAGIGPDDGFTGYKALTFPATSTTGRWGDYSAAVATSDGSIWFADEYIGQVCPLGLAIATGFSCGGTRTLLANWGTFISHVDPSKITTSP